MALERIVELGRSRLDLREIRPGNHDQVVVLIVKADVEGGELMVVRGAEKLIKESRPIFYLEVNADYCRRYGYEPVDLYHFFELHNYRAFDIREGVITDLHGSASKEDDVLFMPEERSLD